jgi:hypothetical protein
LSDNRNLPKIETGLLFIVFRRDKISHLFLQLFQKTKKIKEKTMFIKYFSRNLSLSFVILLLCIGSFTVQSNAQIVDSPAKPEVSDENENRTNLFFNKFALCGSECNSSLFYVGNNFSNNATAKGVSSFANKQPDRIFRNIANLGQVLNLPFVDRRKAGTPNVEFADSKYEITANKIGFSKKSEEITATSLSGLSDVKATVKLFWGDTLWVTSGTLPIGSNVQVQVKRIMGGSGDASIFSFYDVNSETYINGNKIVSLNYKLSKAPDGPNVETGTVQEISLFTAKVGQLFNVESLLEVIDGVTARSNSTHFLTGASDSVTHEIILSATSSQNACLRSASKMFGSGNCN